MKLLIIHLSDIHAKAASDPVFERRDALVASVRHLTSGTDAVVLAVSGDLTQSATEEQFSAVWNYLSRMQTQLAKNIVASSQREVPVHLIAVPGNHDADLSTHDRVRDLVITSITAESLDDADNDSIFSVCAGVHETFFTFLDQHSIPQRKVTGRRPETELAYEFECSLPQGSVRVLCCNTAWMSRIKEVQGSLYFPPEMLPTRASADTLVVAMFHHPYNWLRMKNARAFRQKVEDVADIILTGHEHDADWRTQQGPAGLRSLYIEGGILQASDNPHHSTFNAVSVDTDQSKQKIVLFSWDGSRYEPSEGRWEDLQVNRLHQMGRYELKSDFEQILTDPGIPHGRSDLFEDLEEFFVYPDIKQEPRNGDDVHALTDGNQIRDAVLSEHLLVILGEDHAGKTSLARMLFRQILSSGYVPVLINGSGKRPPQGERLQRFIEESFVEQYATPDRLTYQQLGREHKVVVVDDFHRFKFGRSGPWRFLSSLGEEAAHVVILADEFQMQLGGAVESLLVEPRAVPYPVYRIQPFGRAKQVELINRWLTLTEGVSETGLSIAHRFSEVKGLLDDVLASRMVPAYPVFLLSVLQEIPDAVDAAAASKGHFHELLIRRAIAHERGEQEIDFLMSYLRNLAYRIYKSGGDSLGNSVLRAFHREYEEKYAIDRSRENTLSALRKIRILSRSDDVAFRYEFVFYYFVALYMREDLGDDELRAEIGELATRLHEQTASGILLFLTHLSKQPVVIDSVVLVAQEQLAEVEPGFTEDDGRFLVDLIGGSKSVAYREADEIDMHRKIATVADHLDEHLDGNEVVTGVESESSPDGYSGPGIGAAMNIIELLGQLLRSFPGSLEASVKEKLAAACIDLGLRIIGSCLEGLHRHEDEIVAKTAGMLSKMIDEAALDESEARELAGICLSAAGMGIVLAVMGRIVASLKSRDVEVTCERVMADRDTAAERVLSVGIALQRRRFPMQMIRRLARDFRDTELAFVLVRWLVLQILTLHGVDRQTKQQACAALRIEYQETLRLPSVDRGVTNIVS